MGDDIYPWYLRRYGHIFCEAYPARCSVLSWSKEPLRCTGFSPSLTSGRARGRDDAHSILDIGFLHCLLQIHLLGPDQKILSSNEFFPPSFPKYPGSSLSSRFSLDKIPFWALPGLPIRVVKVRSISEDCASSIVYLLQNSPLRIHGSLPRAVLASHLSQTLVSLNLIILISSPLPPEFFASCSSTVGVPDFFIFSPAYTEAA